MFKFFKKKKEPENIKEILSQFQELKLSLEKLSQELGILKKKNSFAIQKLGIVRFNPFKETGGNQSFSIALLDDHNNGLVITSLYGREGNRVFAKPIENNKSKYLLSEEEKKALEKAKKSNSFNQRNQNGKGK